MAHSVDEYGFKRADDFDEEMYQEFRSYYFPVLARRLRKWEKIKDKIPSVGKSSLKYYVRKGIPYSIRPRAWFVVSGCIERRDLNSDLYTQFLKGPFQEDMKESIRIDIPRTFPDNIFFQRPEDGHLLPLYNVLLAFGSSTPEIGYCQGLNYVAAVLLLITKSEDTTFWLLYYLVNDCLPDYYGKQMKGLLIDMAVLTDLVKSRIPAVGHHIEDMGVDWGLIATKWFLCLFIEVLPFETVLRIWDCLFLEGDKILFRVSLTIIKLLEKDLLEASNAGEIVDCFKKFFICKTVLNCHQFMKAIFKIPGSLSRAEIRKLREKHS